MKNTAQITRRQWLREGLLYGAVGGTFVSFGILLLDVWLAAGRFTPAQWKRVAPASSLGTKALIPFMEHRTALIVKGERVAALNLECSHLGCLVNPVEEGFYCPCHGSEFGPQGKVYSGPANASLKWYDIRNHSGWLWIRTGEKRRFPRWVSLV